MSFMNTFDSREIAMLTLRDHGVGDYADLRDMDATDVGVLDEDDRACLDELGQYLVESGAGKRFAIWLLHKHFEPNDGEVFVESLSREPRATRTAPIDRSAFGEELLNTTAIRFGDRSDAGVDVIGMEFAAAADFGDRTAPFGDSDEAALAGIADRLCAHGKIDRFGVRLIRNPLGLSEQELLQETRDVRRRTLHCNVAERDVLLADKSVIQTAWRWRVVNGETAPIVMQECTAGCVAVGEGHDIEHKHEDLPSSDT
jgi:hypothetical protein